MPDPQHDASLIVNQMVKNATGDTIAQRQVRDALSELISRLYHTDHAAMRLVARGDVSFHEMDQLVGDIIGKVH